MTGLVRDSAWASWQTSESLSRRGNVVLVAVGAVEQHGPHLPLGTDAWVATEIAIQVAAKRSQVLVGEPLPYGCSAHHRAFPGTVSLGVRTFINLICDVARSLHEHGMVPVFINGHGGNRGPLQTAAQALLEESVPVWALSYFELIRDEALAIWPPENMGHACALETSIVLHLWPDSVGDAERLKPGAQGRWPDVSLFPSAPGDMVVHPLPFGDLDDRGVVGAPATATAADGQSIFAAAVRRVGEAVDRILAEGSVEGTANVR